MQNTTGIIIQKQQNNLVQKKQKMSYNDMQQWAHLIESYFPTEKSVSLIS